MTTYSEWGPEHGELEFIKRHSISACNVLKRLLGIRSAGMNYSCSLRKADQEVLLRKQGEADSHRVNTGCPGAVERISRAGVGGRVGVLTQFGLL